MEILRGAIEYINMLENLLQTHGKMGQILATALHNSEMSEGTNNGTTEQSTEFSLVKVHKNIFLNIIFRIISRPLYTDISKIEEASMMGQHKTLLTIPKEVEEDVAKWNNKLKMVSQSNKIIPLLVLTNKLKI